MLSPGVIFKLATLGVTELLLAALLIVANVATEPALYALLASLVGTAAGIYLARRRAGGTVRSSEAAELWEEGAALRDFLREQLQVVKDEFDALTKRVETLTDTNDGLRMQLEQAQQLVILLRAERDELQHLVEHLKQILAQHGIPHGPPADRPR